MTTQTSFYTIYLFDRNKAYFDSGTKRQFCVLGPLYIAELKRHHTSGKTKLQIKNDMRPKVPVHLTPNVKDIYKSNHRELHLKIRQSQAESLRKGPLIRAKKQWHQLSITHSSRTRILSWKYNDGSPNTILISYEKRILTFAQNSRLHVLHYRREQSEATRCKPSEQKYVLPPQLHESLHLR